MNIVVESNVDVVETSFDQDRKLPGAVIESVNSKNSKEINFHIIRRSLRVKSNDELLPDEQDETISQHLKDGNYGLIHQELFKTTKDKPGIISYPDNPDFPEDNLDTLGGLSPEEVWLSDSYLLVVSGGGPMRDK